MLHFYDLEFNGEISIGQSADLVELVTVNLRKLMDYFMCACPCFITLLKYWFLICTVLLMCLTPVLMFSGKYAQLFFSPDSRCQQSNHYGFI